MSKRLLAIGECMVELSPAGENLYGMGFAGDTFNSAWYARQLGSEALRVGYLSAIGDDEISTRMAGFMTEAGIETELQVIPGSSVGLYMISLNNGERSFSYWRSASAAKQLTKGLSALPDMSRGDLALFSGITLAILPDEGRWKLLDLLRAAHAQGVEIAFDPNLRPRLWRDTSEMRRWVSAAAEISDIVLPSFEDEQVHFGDASTAATVARYRQAGARLIVIKNGPGDVIVVRNAQPPICVTPVPIAEPVDTTAAGDAFNAGFLVAYLAGASLTEAAEAGCAVSAKVIAAPGALVAL